MADNRKYYYLKLKEDFFDTDEMKILESMKDGYLYSNILLKLYLKSLSNSGRLMYRNVIPYTPEILATLTGHQVGTVEKALDVFKKLDLIEMLDNGAIYMMDIQNFIGQSSSEADRQREYYNRMKAEKEALAGESTETPELPEPKEPVLPAEQKSNKAIGNYTTDFEELWEAYPRKVDKGQAYKKYDKDGNVKPVKIEKTKKHVPPDVTAQIFWLKNRQRDRWQDRPQDYVDQSGDNDTEVQIYLPDNGRDDR